MFESLDSLLRWIPPQIKEVIGAGILPAGGKLVVAGDAGTFKTMLSTYAGFQISQGKSLLGFSTTKVKVGMLQSELPKYAFRERISQLVRSNGSSRDSDILFATELELKVNKPIGYAQLASAVKQNGIGLLILDPLYKILAGDISDWSEMAKLTDNLDAITRAYNCSIWLTHHRRKQQMIDGEITDMGTDELIGSSELKDWADTIIRISILGGDELLMSFPKTRNARMDIPSMKIKFNRSTLGFCISGLEDKS